MDWKKLGSKIKKFAPLLGTVIPGGSLATGVISMVADAIGAEPAPESIARAINNPDVRAKLIELQATHKTELQRLALQSDQIFLADRASARNREVELAKATGKRDYTLSLLAIALVVGFFTVCGVMMYKPLPDGQSEVVYMLFGNLGSGFTAVLGYYFGSSKGSSEKTTMLKKD